MKIKDAILLIIFGCMMFGCANNTTYDYTVKIDDTGSCQTD